jgi:hypothetical protein
LLIDICQDFKDIDEMRLLPSLLALLSFCHPSNADDRVALVIGNGNYQHATKLPNPVNDATVVESKLRAAGFQTIVSKDAGIDALTSRLEQFYAAAKGGDTAVVFYAGHGIEHDKINYLLPTDAQLIVGSGLEGDALLASKRALLKRETIPLDALLTDLSRTGARLKLVVLDCCRDDPKLAAANPGQVSRSWASRGFNAGTLSDVKEETIPEGTMLVFSTAPGTAASDGTGSNSPFTTAVMQSLQPGYSISRVFTEAAIAMKGQEPYIRFDGSGKAMAAFGTSAIVPGVSNSPAPGNAPNPAPQRPFMQVKVDGNERQLPLIPADELAKLRATIPEIKEVNRAFRLDLTSQDVGKKISGIAFEARNRTGINTAIYQVEPCHISMARTKFSKTEWRRATLSSSELFELTTFFFTPAKSGGEQGYQFAQSSGRYMNFLPSGALLPIIQMKKGGWIMMSKGGENEEVSRPVYAVINSTLLLPGRHETPIKDVEAVLIFYQP